MPLLEGAARVVPGGPASTRMATHTSIYPTARLCEFVVGGDNVYARWDCHRREMKGSKAIPQRGLLPAVTQYVSTIQGNEVVLGAVAQVRLLRPPVRRTELL